jgi:hypothetical protein
VLGASSANRAFNILGSGDFMKHQIRFAMVFAVICAIGLVLAAEFDSTRRLLELKTEAEKNTVLKPNDVQELIKTYTQYNEVRNNEFSNMIATLGSKDVGLLTPRYVGSISNIIKSTEARDSEMQKLPENARKIYLAFKNAEIEYLDKMKYLKISSARDRIVDLNAYLTTYTKDLGIIWEGILNQDGSYDEQERKISDEIQEIFRQTAQEVAESKRTMKEYIQKSIEAAIKVGLGQAAGLLDKLKELLVESVKELFNLEDKTVGRLLSTRQKVQERAATLRNYYNIEKRGILVLFDDTYYTAKKFINDNGFDQAKITYDEALKDSAKLSSEGTPGQREDGKIFADKAMSILGNHLGVMKDTFNNFVYKYEGIFFGPVGPKITADLLEMRTWEEENAETQRIDLEGFLRRFSDETNEDFKPLFVKISGLTDADRSNLERTLKDKLSQMRNEIEETTKQLSNQNMQQLLLEERKELQKQLESGKK